MQSVMVETDINTLYFIIDDLHICVELTAIEKIIPLPTVEPIPYSTNDVAGMINVAGKSMPLIDLAIRLGKTRQAEYSLDTPILICRQDDKKMALIIDKIVKLTYADLKSIQLTTELTNDGSGLFKGVVPIDDQMALLLNISSLFNNQLISKQDGLAI